MIKCLKCCTNCDGEMYNFFLIVFRLLQQNFVTSWDTSQKKNNKFKVGKCFWVKWNEIYFLIREELIYLWEWKRIFFLIIEHSNVIILLLPKNGKYKYKKNEW